jgi:hypothetical protein
MIGYAECVVRWVIAAVFLAAALPKLADPEAFSAIIGAYGILPKSLQQPVAVILPVFELICAGGILWKRAWAYLGICLMLLCFLAVLGNGIFLGLDIDCGCFGPEDPEHIAFSGLRIAFARDVVLMVLLIFSFWYQKFRNNR